MTFDKLLLIGLDSAAPALVFDRWRDRLPTLSGLMARGAHARMLSSNPPITVPAWTCLASGYDPGELGCYGFRNRIDHSYDGYRFATSAQVRAPRLWDRLSEQGKHCVVLGVPQTYPPTALNGEMVSCFLTPSTQSAYTYPPSLKAEVEAVTDGYVVDVDDFRTTDKAALLERIYTKTRKHLALAKHMLRTRPWDFCMLVEMGTDRIHHAFWSYVDPTHHKYEAGNPFERSILEYYEFVDGELAELLSICPPDTGVVVVSDHGAKKMDGGVCFNEWLMRQGYLTLADAPSRPTPIASATIDWSRTQAWGDGGYYGRLFLNVRGREPSGTVEPHAYEATRDALIASLEAMVGPDGRALGTKAYRPEDLYREVGGVAPDLLVYFGDLDWRSIGTVGTGQLFVTENDSGPDEANHDWYGIFILSTSGADATRAPLAGELPDVSIYDVAPTVLSLMGQTVPDGLRGTALC